MPKISVVIPAYNAEATILETIESIQKQTFEDLEILVINDGSTDQTLERLSHINDSRLKILSFENGGISIARNRGIAAAEGELVSFIDADDLWTPDKLEDQWTALQQNPDAGVAYSWTFNMRTLGDKEAFTQGCSSTATGNVFPELLLANFIGSGSNILIRRSVIEQIGGFDPRLRGYADWDFYLRVAAVCDFVVIPKPQILYRQTSSSMSSKVEAMEQEGLLFTEQAYQMAPPELQHLKSQTLAAIYRYCAGLSLANDTNANQLNYAQQRLWMAIKLQPLLLREIYTRNLIIKLLIKRLLPDAVYRSVLSVLKIPFARRDPRL